MDSSIGLLSSAVIPPSSYIIQMAFFPTLFQELTFLAIIFVLIGVIVLNFQTLSKARTPSLGQVFSSHSRPLHPATQVLCIIGLTIIATMSSSDFSYCIALTFLLSYILATCYPSIEFIDPGTCRM
jgi:hypothetical protein